MGSPGKITASHFHAVTEEEKDKVLRLSLAIEGSGTGVWDRNVATGEIHYSAGWKAILGYGENELSNRIEDSYSRVHPDDLAYVQAAIQDHFDRRTGSYCVEHRIRCKDGSYKWISSRGMVFSRDALGKPLRMVGTTTDITALRTLAARLQDSVDLVTSMADEIPGMVFQSRIDSDGAVAFLYVSAGANEIYELTPAEPVSLPSAILDRIHPDDVAAYEDAFARCTETVSPLTLEYRVVLPRQGVRWRHCSARPKRLTEGATLWHGLVADITDRKQNEIELNEYATIDFLTQLPNRRYFLAKFTKALLADGAEALPSTAVLTFDLDHFKTINDRYGHPVGDRVLQSFAAILKQQLRKNDLVGRIGGEEFAVVLPNAGVEDAAGFSKRVQHELAQNPVMFGANALAVTTSIGITLTIGTDDSANAALARSDLALYQAKNAGRNRLSVVLG
jgi:diguanylate cyclase (GGDEF)-like protein/PAS domain S-box-containing protein